MIPFQPAFIGNPQYTIGVGHGIGQDAALVALRRAGRLDFNGIPINIGIDPFPDIVVDPAERSRRGRRARDSRR